MQLPLHRLALAPALLLCAALNVAAQQQPQSIGELYATDASVKGSVILAGSGTSVLSGSSIQAGAQAATLKLDRGGSLFVCEGTKLTVNSSQSGRQLLLSLNTGNLELNYSLGTEADTLLTPDLQLLMPGPGTVHLAVRVSPDGDTCVQSLPWNASAIVVSETMGDATYQVKPDEAVLFKGGHLNQGNPTKQNCGCPKVVPTQVAKIAPPPPPAPAPPTPADISAGAILPQTAQARATEPLASAAPPEQHLSVDAPFIFHGNDPDPDLRQNVVMLKLSNTKMMNLEPTVLPPAANKKKTQTQPAQAQTAPKESHGFFSKVGAFFASIFH
jgi:hypothetical protein